MLFYKLAFCPLLFLGLSCLSLLDFSDCLAFPSIGKCKSVHLPLTSVAILNF